jgi:2-phospho-L-lactate guanylyltransferase
VYCKRRLSAVLEPQERLELVRRMLDHVLAAAAGSTHVNRVLVVSPERDDLRESIDLVTDAGIGLNEALELARQHARAQGAREIVVLPADLPRLATGDVDALIVRGRGAGVAIAPDRRQTGTRALPCRHRQTLRSRSAREVCTHTRPVPDPVATRPR